MDSKWFDKIFYAWFYIQSFDVLSPHVYGDVYSERRAKEMTGERSAQEAEDVAFSCKLDSEFAMMREEEGDGDGAFDPRSLRTKEEYDEELDEARLEESGRAAYEYED